MTVKRRPIYLKTELLLLAFCGVLPVLVHASNLGVDYLETVQLERHRYVIEQTAEAPWVYRQLGEFLVMPMITVSKSVLGASWPAFVALRIMIAVLIVKTLIGRFADNQAKYVSSVVVFGLLSTSSLFDSDISINTYLEIFFGVQLWSIWKSDVVRRGYLLKFVFLSLVAVLNRETILILLGSIFLVEFLTSINKGRANTPRLLTTGLALLLATFAYLLVRILVGNVPIMQPYGHQVGIDLMKYNLRAETLIELSPHIVVMAGVLTWTRYLPTKDRLFSLIFLPSWSLIHLFFSVLAESRTSILPVLVAFIGILDGVNRSATPTGSVIN